MASRFALPTPAAPYVVALVLAGALSSLIGLRGILSVWLISPLADLVFTAGTLLAFHVVASLRIHWSLAALLGFFAHWAVYAASWTLVEPRGDAIGGVFEVGVFGLGWCALATAGLSAWRQGLVRVSVGAAPARSP